MNHLYFPRQDTNLKLSIDTADDAHCFVRRVLLHNFVAGFCSFVNAIPHEHRIGNLLNKARHYAITNIKMLHRWRQK